MARRQLIELESPTCQSLRFLTYDDDIRTCFSLQPSRQIRCVTQDRPRCRNSFADEIAGDDEAGSDPDADLEFMCTIIPVQSFDRIYRTKRCSDGSFRIVFMGMRVFEIDQ
nr:hypothetical protein [Ruegeria arenilitoris]